MNARSTVTLERKVAIGVILAIMSSRYFRVLSVSLLLSCYEYGHTANPEKV